MTGALTANIHIIRSMLSAIVVVWQPKSSETYSLALALYLGMIPHRQCTAERWRSHFGEMSRTAGFGDV